MSQRFSLKASIGKIRPLSFVLAFLCLLLLSCYSHDRLLTSACTGLFLAILYFIVYSGLGKKRKAEERLRRLYATISQVNKSILYARDEADLFQRVCTVAVESGKFRMAWVGLLDDERRFVLPAYRAGYGTEYLDEIKISVGTSPEGMGPTGGAIREGKHYICNAIRTDPAMAAWREQALKRAFRSSIALPLLKFGKPIGSLSLYSEEENFFDQEKVSLLDEVARDLSFTLEIFEKEERRKKAENDVRAEKQFSDSIINMLPGIFYLYDENLFFRRWNNQFEEISGYRHDELAAMKVLDFFEGPHRERVRKKTETVLTAGRCDIEAELTTKSGENIPFYFTGTKVNFSGAPCVLGVGIDVSRLKEAEEQFRQSEEDLRDLASNLQNIREEERTAIAREIHDELGQQLTAVKLDVSWLDRKIQAEPLIRERIADVLAMLTDMIHSIRRISTQLRPSILDDLGLIEALKWQVRDFQKRLGIPVTLECPEEPLKLEAGTTTGLFRIFQETLTNIARHAEATVVSALLCKDGGQLVLTISDNGKGFDLRSAGKRKTMGLLGMKERTLMMKGAYEISSQPGTGTTLRISVPLNTFEPHSHKSP